MKNIGAFFLLIFMLVSMLPCTDEVTFIEEATSADQQVSHDEHSEDSCSSLCICTCCGQRIVIVDQIKFRIQTPDHFQYHTIKNYQFHLEQLSSNIWQPPKIA